MTSWAEAILFTLRSNTKAIDLLAEKSDAKTRQSLQPLIDDAHQAIADICALDAAREEREDTDAHDTTATIKVV